MKALRFSPTAYLLATILALGFFARAYGLDFPRYHWDENIDFGSVFYASFNYLQLQTYVHGSFSQYLILLIWDAWLLMAGVSPTTQNLLLAFFGNATPFLILARGLTVVVGTANGAAVYFLGRRLYNERVGLLAAFFLAGAFLSVSEAHYARGHTLAAFLVTLAVFFCARILADGRRRDYLLAGVCVGFATAAHFSALVGIAPIVAAYIARARALWRESWRELVIAFDAAGAAFFIGTPYALFNFSNFAGEMKWFVTQELSRTWVSPEGQPIWLFYLTEHLKNGLGLGLEAAALIGVGYALYRRENSDWVLLAFPILLFFSLARGVNFARYAVLLIPFLAIAAAHWLDAATRWAESRLQTRWARVALGVAAIGLMMQPIQNIARYDYWLTQPDTRQIALNWILQNVPDGATMLVEGAGVLGPQVPESRAQLDAKIAAEPPNTVGYFYLQALRANQRALRGYRAETVFRLDQRHESGILAGTIASAQEYAAQGVDYLITVDWMQTEQPLVYSDEFQRSLAAAYEPLMDFKPTIAFRFDPYAWRMDYDALAQIIPGQPGIGGPRLTIYRRRGG